MHSLGQPELDKIRDGGSRLVYWLLGALFAILLLLTGGVVGAFNDRLADVEQEQRRSGDRLTYQEALAEQTREQLKQINITMKDMASELRELNRRGNRP